MIGEMDMKALLICIGLALALAGCESSRIAEAATEGQWAERVSRIQIGMRRQEVESILQVPQATSYQSSTTKTGSAQGVVYFVAPGYTVTVFYDYSGVPRDANGNALSTNSPDNRVIQRAELNHLPVK